MKFKEDYELVGKCLESYFKIVQVDPIIYEIL